MELKEAILQTLAEIQDTEIPPKSENSKIAERDALLGVSDASQWEQEGGSGDEDSFSGGSFQREFQQDFIAKKKEMQSNFEHLEEGELREELVALKSRQIKFLFELRERMLVLFEGLQMPNNAHLQEKLELTLNFLEYALALIDERLNKEHVKV